MLKEYHHEELGVEIRSIAGYYLIESENQLPLSFGNILFLEGHGVVETSCCGIGGCQFAKVIGKIHNYRMKKDDEGRDVSIIEPIVSNEEQRCITKIVKQDKTIQQVDFWKG